MSCTSTKRVLRIFLLFTTFVISCVFIASLIWTLSSNNKALYSENYQLSRLNVSAYRNNASEKTETVSNASQTLVKMEISIRRVEENSRRLKEYTRSLLWDNKDKSLWCILFKDGESKQKESGVKRNNIDVNEDFLDKLRNQSKDKIWHVRHSMSHHLKHKI